MDTPAVTWLLAGSGANPKKEFSPHVLVIPAGSTVSFPNHDPFNHNVFSVSEPNQFDLGLYGRGEAKGYTFTSPGLVRVFCNIHPRMVAFVLLQAARPMLREIFPS